MWPLNKKQVEEPQPSAGVRDADRGFGIFAPLLQDTIAYLKLLHLGDSEAAHVISSVIECCRSTLNPYEDICLLLGHINWRPHLVAAVAIATLPFNPDANRELWAAIDSGSWVTPQLAAAASFRDPAFAQHAQDRLRTGCRVDASRSAGLSAPERHSATGTGGSLHRSAKSAASLIRLLELRETGIPVSEELPADVIALAGKDVDGSGDIAENWLKMLTSQLADLGVSRADS